MRRTTGQSAMSKQITRLRWYQMMADWISSKDEKKFIDDSNFYFSNRILTFKKVA